jgi:hypothetical protein
VSFYAVDDIGDAVDATKALLLPVDRGTWLRLAIVVFFVGGGGGGFGQVGNGVSSNTGGGTPASSTSLGSLGSTELLIVGVVVALLVAVVLAFAFVGAAMEFVFVESLRRETVRIRDYWRAHWRRGARLFGFRLGLGLATLAVVAIVVGAAAAPILLGVAPVGLLLLLVAVPIVVVVAVVGAVVGGFTTTFVVPTMLVEERGVLAAWRRFWPTLRAGWKQYAVYALVVFGLRVAAGLLAAVVTILAGLALAIPTGLLALLGFALTETVTAVGWGVVGLAVVVFLLGLFAVSLVVAVPIQTFLRYYGLFVLGDTDAALDVVPERRRAVRE